MNSRHCISTLLLIISLNLLISNTFSQTYFNNEFRNDLTTNSLGSSVCSLKDTSGYIVVGNIPMSSKTYTKLMFLNILGDTIWTKTIGNPLLHEYSGIGKLINIGDTNFVFTGTTFTDSVSNSTDSAMISLTKFDRSGNVLWRYYYGNSNKISYGNDLQQTLDGGYIISGWTTGWGNTNYTSSFLLKVDSLGNQEWYKIFGGSSSNHQRESQSVDLADNKGFILSGRFYQGLATRQDINIIKTDSLGNVIWNKTYGTPEDDTYGHIVKYGNSGDYILTAAIDIVSGNILEDFQGYIARISGVDGSIVWDDTTGIVQNGTNDSFESNAIILNNGDLIGIGGTAFTSTPGGGADSWLVKYDGNGNKLWQRTFNKYGGNNQHYFWDIKQTYDNGFVICGDITNFSIPEKNMWVLKLDSLGCEIANCSVGVEEEIALKEPVKVYPNPANSIVAIQYNETTFTNSTFNLIDVMGKEVLNKRIESNSTSIDISSYSKGVYFYQLINQKQRVSGKLIIQ